MALGWSCLIRCVKPIGCDGKVKMLMHRFKIKLNSQWAFYALLAMLMMMLFARHAMDIAIPDVLFIGVSVLMVISGNRDQVLPVLVMCIPLGTVFTTIYTCLAGIATWTIRYKSRIRVNFTFIPVLLMIIWELIHCLWGGFSIKPFIGLWSPYLICILLMWQDVSDIDYRMVVRCLAVCTAVMCLTLLGMVLKRSGFHISTAFMNMQRLGQAAEEDKAGVLQINPNSLGVICTLAISGLLQLITTGRGRRLDLMLALIMVICGVLTTSRTFLLLLLTIVLLFWINQEGGFVKKLRFLLLIAAAATVSVVILAQVFPVAIENFIYRLTVVDLTSGRGELFRTYNRFLGDQPKVLLVGVGVMDFAEKVVSKYAVAINIPHNGIQEILVAWGIPGLALIIWFLGTMLRRSGKNLRKRRLLSYIPLLLLLLKIQLGQMITSSYTMMALVFCYLSLAYDFNCEPAAEKNDHLFLRRKRRINRS